jgi:arylsulfatase
VYSQFQWRDQGIYMICNRRYKYVYSAPDRREFLFDRVQDPDETRNRAGVTFCQGALDEMRQRLFAYYRQTGYQDALDGDRWRLYPQPSIPRDPDAGLLIQDAGWAKPYQDIPGYSEQSDDVQHT